MLSNLESEIQEILFNIGRDVKIHKLVDGNLILEIDYELYTKQLIDLFYEYSRKQ